MTKEEVITKIFNKYAMPTSNPFFFEILKALEQEPSGDAISRQAVLDLMADYDLSMGQVVRGIHALPPVKPQEPKIGHWEWVQYNYNPQLGNWHCSECKCVVVECVGKEEKGGIPLYKYCPQCGAKMEVSE